MEASEIEKEALKLFEDEIVPALSSKLISKGSFEPIVIVGMENEGDMKFEIFPIGSFMGSDSGKDVLSLIMRRAGATASLVFISMFTEAWMRMVDKTKEGFTEEDLKVRPSEAADKVEVFMGTFETKNIQTQHIYKMIRDNGITLEKVKELDEPGGKFRGRFVNLFNDFKKERKV